MPLSKDMQDVKETMKSFYLMNNPIRDYAWGHPAYIPDLLNIDWPEGKPAAELWMGAHTSSPSHIQDEGVDYALDSWMQKNSPSNSVRYGGRLPFLFKLLAVGHALSIQAHPDKASAEAGFAREEAKKIPRDSPSRNYKDDNHKPEILMALTTFSAMIGFRNPVDVYNNFQILSSSGALELISPSTMEKLKHNTDDALRAFMEEFLGMLKSSRKDIVNCACKLVTSGHNLPWDALQREWIIRLSKDFPEDPGVLAPLFLHLVQINPGEALYQPARKLHAYLDGFGVELMANSDNVLRGGLTVKHIDTEELRRNLDFQPSSPQILRLPHNTKVNTVNFFPIPSPEFALGMAYIDQQKGPLMELAAEGPRILLNLEGEISLEDSKHRLLLSRGQSAFVPAGRSLIRIGGKGRMAVAECGR